MTCVCCSFGFSGRLSTITQHYRRVPHRPKKTLTSKSKFSICQKQLCGLYTLVKTILTLRIRDVRNDNQVPHTGNWSTRFMNPSRPVRRAQFKQYSFCFSVKCFHFKMLCGSQLRAPLCKKFLIFCWKLAKKTYLMHKKKSV